MADYFPILSRAVASLDPNTREHRQALYDRARKTLTEKLSDPNLAHADLKAESAALEAAINRVEMEVVRGAEPARPRPPQMGAQHPTPPRPKPPREAPPAPAAKYEDMPPLKETRKVWRLVAGVVGVALIVGAGMAAFSLRPRNLAEVRSMARPNAPVVAEQSDAKTDYVRLRQLVYYRTNQPVGTIVVDKSQTFLYVVRPNLSALRYNIGVGTQCNALAGLYHVVRKEEVTGNQSGDLGARVLYLDKETRIHGSNPAGTVRQLPEGCIRLINDDVIYLYDRTPLESRVVVSN
jgi:lipoprotein-anchoring transpeptidase ErfK/SrfK